MEGKNLHCTRLFFLLVCSVGLLTLPGCVGVAAQLLNVIHGNKIKAAYNGLEGKRVAIVCVSAESAYGPDNASHQLANALAMKLTHEDLDIELIHQSEIENWLDSNWDDIDYVEIGRAVHADRVIAVDVETLSIHEGSTLYKGRSNQTVKVFDMEQGGKVVFQSGHREFEFPKTHGQPTTSVSERQFQSFFITEMANDIARYFYDYDFPETVASESARFGG